MTDPVAIPRPDLEELRRLAERATPGPWTWDAGTAARSARVVKKVNELGFADSFIPGTAHRYHDAAYIAAANPAAILALLNGTAGYVLVNADSLAEALERTWIPSYFIEDHPVEEAAAAILAALEQ